MMGHVFQAEWWTGYPRWCSFGSLWIRKLAKAMAKASKRHEALIGIFFMKIMEIRRKGR